MEESDLKWAADTGSRGRQDEPREEEISYESQALSKSTRNDRHCGPRRLED